MHTWLAIYTAQTKRVCRLAAIPAADHLDDWLYRAAVDVSRGLDDGGGIVWRQRRRLHAV